MTNIPFHRALVLGTEEKYLKEAFGQAQFSGSGQMTKRCSDWLKNYAGGRDNLMVTSGSTALDMVALLSNVEPGDEVIMPSYTFVSTASAFVLRRAVPVFVDVRKDTLNLDEKQVEAAITPKTKAIVPIHYAGVSAELDPIQEVARRHKLLMIEDAAQGLWSYYKGKPLGTIGDMGTVSFHATKNVHGGEAGSVFVRDHEMFVRGEVIREKGTNRSQFFRGEVDKYTWVDVGAAFAPSELNAAFLLAQLEASKDVTVRRLKIFNTYLDGLRDLEKRELVKLPVVPEHCVANGHIFYTVLPNTKARESLTSFAKEKGVGLSPHYVPLHSSPAGKKFGRTATSMKVTDWAFEGLLRFPMWLGVEEHQAHVMEVIHDWAKTQ